MSSVGRLGRRTARCSVQYGDGLPHYNTIGNHSLMYTATSCDLVIMDSYLSVGFVVKIPMITAPEIGL